MSDGRSGTDGGAAAGKRQVRDDRTAHGHVDPGPDGFRAVLALDEVVAAQLDHTLFELVKLRASMINGCAFCVDMVIAPLWR